MSPFPSSGRLVCPGATGSIRLVPSRRRLGPLCLLRSRSGRSPSVRSPKASSSSPCERVEFANPTKRFRVEHDRFFLYPTFDHQRHDLVRESHIPELSRALEEGVWAEGEPPVETLNCELTGAIPQPDRVRIRAWAELAGHFTITDPRCVDALSPFYVWSTDYAAKRLEWKRHHPLHVLLLRTYRIPRPVTVRVKDEYGGCRSWLELQRDLPFEGTPGALGRRVRAGSGSHRRDRRRRRSRARLASLDDHRARLGRARARGRHRRRR